MIVIQAPYPLIVATVILRNPEFQDSKAISDSVLLQRAMDGTPYTTVRRTDNRYLFQYQFEITRLKALEFEAFHKEYINRHWMLTDFNEDVFDIVCKTNPLNLQMDRRAVAGQSKESVHLTLEFEGVQIGP